jgi:hypothetical protein
VLSFFVAQVAEANVIQRTDVDRMQTLVKKASDLHGSVAQSAESTFTSLANLTSPVNMTSVIKLDTCLQRLVSATNQVESSLALLWKEAALASLMRNKTDETTTLSFLRVELSSIVDDYDPLSKQIANEVSGMCQGSALVVTKAQALLDLVGEVEGAIALLNRRIGPGGTH